VAAVKWLHITQAITTSVRIRTLFKVTPQEYGLALLAIPLVVSVRVALWVMPSRSILRFVRKLENSPERTISNARVSASTIVWAVEVVSKHVPRASCLTQAVAGRLLLEAFGQHAQLCLGVAKAADGTFRAHAWLERAGRPILGGSKINSMVRLSEFPEGTHLPTSLAR
jgi:hypothetical protein